MRAYLPAYELRAPASLEETLRILRAEPAVWRPFAGGTDLMVVYETGKLAHKKYLSIWALDDLRGIETARDFVTLGALTTYAEVQAERVLRDEFPMLCKAASETGAVAIQNRGTLGGNIANASPAADSPPALLAYDAEVELVSTAGSRWVEYRSFHTGYKTTVMRPDELIARVRLPRVARERVHHYRKVGTRKAQAISKVCFAGLADVEDGIVRDLRLCFGSIAATTFRATKTEELIRGRRPRVDGPALVASACVELGREIAPIDDIRSTSVYRRQVARNLLTEFLERL